jgi:hypothetical protein
MMSQSLSGKGLVPMGVLLTRVPLVEPQSRIDQPLEPISMRA